MHLDPHWIAGFVDGEGCFHISINLHNDMEFGFQVLPEFTVVQHERDVEILYALKSYFNCGVVRVNHGDRMAFRVRGLEHLRCIIIPFFDLYPLRTRKRIDFEKFKDVLELMHQKQHLTQGGIEKIRSISMSMNRKQIKIKSDLHGDMQRVGEITTPFQSEFGK
jgi:LAGLIDADG endonuclease